MGAGLPAGQPRLDPTAPDDAYRDLSPRALGSVSRAYFDSTSRNALRRRALSGAAAPTSPPSARRRQDPKLCEVKGPALYSVTSLAFDPDVTDPVLHHQQRRLARPRRAGPGDRAIRRLLKDARIGDLAFNRAGPLAVGRPALQRVLDAGPLPASLHEWNQVYTCRTGGTSSTSTSRPTARSSSARCRRSAGARAAPDAHPGAARGRRHLEVLYEFGSCDPRRTSCSRPTGGTSSAAPTTPASPTSSATTSPAVMEPLTQRRDGLLQAGPLRGLPRRLPLYGPGDSSPR